MHNRLVPLASLVFTLLMVSYVPALAEIGLPPLISDGAVLQRNEPIPIWGTAPANTEVSVTLGNKQQSVRSDESGAWHVEFPALPAGGPLSLRVSAEGETREVKNLYIGDVWVGSGQSNMEWVLRKAQRGAAEIAAADIPEVRHFKVPLTWSAAPENELAGGEWHPATQERKGEFSAVSYFFAKKIHNETGIPIGLIGTNWGGSAIEAWMSPQALGKSLQQTQSSINVLVAESEKQTTELRRTLQQWPDTLTDTTASEAIELADADWSAAQLITDDWLTLEAPALWEQQGFPGVDGVVWYRKTFTLDESEAAKPAELNLARIDDNDTTWINGHRVGSTEGYDIRRQYTVPAEYLQAGENTVAIRVEDAGGGGGIYSSPELLTLETGGGKSVRLAGSWKIKADKVVISPVANVNHVDTALYNKMLYPLYRSPVKGVIWYQGESNADNLQEARQYEQQFQALIRDWREGWQQPEMPFYWVQLANFDSGSNTKEGKPWAVVREAQTAALALPNTGQAITIDIGNPNDIHPRDKRTVGQRLAQIALNKTYGKNDVHYRGPHFSEVEINENAMVVEFESAKPLAVSGNDKTVQGFEVVTKDGTVQHAEGTVKKSSVILQLDQPKEVAEVRYAWDDNPEDANLMDTSGLPAEPFRTNVQ